MKMVRPSNPRFMNKVLDAVSQLRETKGSSIRDILQYVKKGSNLANRTLTMQVQRALRHGVNAGILKFRNGRYKASYTLTPISKQRRPEEEYKIVEETPMPNVEDSLNSPLDPYSVIQDRRKRRRRRGYRRRNRSRRRRRRSGRGRRRHANEEYEEITHSDKRKIKPKSHEDDASEQRYLKNNRNSDKYSEGSESENESRHRSRRSKAENSQAPRSSSRSRVPEENSEKRQREKDREREKSRRSSSSRHRSQQRNHQAPVEDSDAMNAMDCEDDGQDLDNGRDNETYKTKNCESDVSLNN